MRLLLRLPMLLFALVMGATSSQFPEYSQQYRQRLGGAVDELRTFVERFDRDAGASGLTRERALREYADTQSRFLGRQGTAVAETIQRYEDLAAHQRALESAGPIVRLVHFAVGYQPGIAKRALDDFEPAVPLTAEGAIFAGGGFLVGLFAAMGLGTTARGMGRARRARRPAQRAAR